MKRTLKRLFLSLLVTLLLVGTGFVALNWTYLYHFPSIISAYYAKELCSCVFVVGQTEERCHNTVRQYIPISSYQIDVVEKRVTVSGLGRTNSARFVGERYGCTLENPE